MPLKSINPAIVGWKNKWLLYYLTAQPAGAIEYSDYISAEE